jgi:hypothetical protein
MAKDHIYPRLALTSSESGATGDWMDIEAKQAESKKSYESPRLTTISLRPEEAVLGACKISGSGGSASLSSCTQFVAPCNSLGS